MTDIPIMFSAPMVQAEIDDLKFMSRRLAKRLVKTYPNGRGNPPTVLVERDAPWTRVKVGDRLWVREEWRVSRKWDAVKPADLPPRTMTVAFDAGGSIANQPAGCWAPDNGYPARGVRPEWLGKRRASMHLPRWASRLTLIVTSVKTEPLHAISPDDVYAEGVAAGMMDCGERMFICPVPGRDNEQGTATWAFSELWKHLHGPDSWDENPLVVAMGFRVIKANIDAPEAQAA
ncbi:hypothetical protein ABIF63_004819 [Bradyrhizobium japonicum]|uniref:Uncharacterized protein n=2 Tax=Bradyrhizobium japonicum TaxID=375 RepID=A0ABV2RUU4_BRAJP|nr:hypothetical protein [Bradyrhizobium japonicum]WLB16198.1 hypothetical protein QIH95_29645 [Bradyrhizobium japonicum]